MKYQIKKHWKTQIPYIDTCDAIKGVKDSKVAQSENNDCVVRAFAAITESTYDEAHKYVKDTFDRPNRGGTPRFDSTMIRLASYPLLGMRYERMTNHTETTYTKKRKVFHWETQEYVVRPSEVTVKSKFVPLITTYGKTRLSRMTIGTFLKEYPKGRYLMHVRGHAFAIIDGAVVGNTCDSRRLRARITNAYKFTPGEKS
jgi:hypothetical protein|tara:strand:- start:349 stop:948 length:600 start_codon:yes stop_codon:yes gene_type:complete